MAFFSIIIPVYNTQEYIARCLESCINQTFEDIEIIVVDDCGEDHAIQIAQEFAQKDSRIHIISNPKNLGVFASRINGGRYARSREGGGIYIIYLDSDDFIHQQMCQSLHKQITSYRQKHGVWLDMLGFSSLIFPKPSKGSEVICSPLGEFDQPKILEELMSYWNLWNKTYHHSLIEKTHQFFDTHFCSLPQVNMAEDALKFFVFCVFAQHYYGYDEVLHYYFKNDKSITRDLTSLKRHRNAIFGFNQAIAMLKQIKPLVPNAQKQASKLIETLSNHRRETKHHYWITRATKSKNYIGNLKRAIKATKSTKKKIIAYRKIFLYLISFGLWR